MLLENEAAESDAPERKGRAAGRRRARRGLRGPRAQAADSGGSAGPVAQGAKARRLRGPRGGGQPGGKKRKLAGSFSDGELWPCRDVTRWPREKDEANLEEGKNTVQPWTFRARATGPVSVDAGRRRARHPAGLGAQGGEPHDAVAWLQAAAPETSPSRAPIPADPIYIRNKQLGPDCAAALPCRGLLGFLGLALDLHVAQGGCCRWPCPMRLVP